MEFHGARASLGPVAYADLQGDHPTALPSDPPDSLLERAPG